jgi:hypothetical protein
MRRFGLLACIVVLPVFAGLGCEVTLTTGFIEGDVCDQTLDANQAYCTGNVLTYCGASNVVVTLNCTTDGGTCTGSGTTAACVYPNQLVVGAPCDAVADAAEAYCTTDNTVVYCGDSNIVVEDDCDALGGTCQGTGAAAACVIPLQVGDPCVPATDADYAYCTGDNMLIYCDDTTSIVVESDCTYYTDGTCIGAGSTAECSIPVMVVGLTCDATVDNDNAYCTDTDTHIYCADTNLVVEDDCLGGNGECTGTGVDAACEYPLVPGEACVYNANPNVDFCYGDELTYCADDGFADTWDCTGADCDGTCSAGMCECLWEEGNYCDYWTQYSDADCLGMNLLECSVTNVIISTSCTDYCYTLYGGSAYVSSVACVTDATLGYDVCECTPASSTCTLDDYCNDALWLVTCDGWTNCDTDCTDKGHDKGVCTEDACSCG